MIGVLVLTHGATGEHMLATALQIVGRTPIRALLHMSSGVAFKESNNGQDDVARLGRDLVGGKDTVASVAQFNTRVAPPGTRFRGSRTKRRSPGISGSWSWWSTSPRRPWRGTRSCSSTAARPCGWPAIPTRSRV